MLPCVSLGCFQDLRNTRANSLLDFQLFISILLLCQRCLLKMHIHMRAHTHTHTHTNEGIKKEGKGIKKRKQMKLKHKLGLWD